jgi:membrane protease YdiL (CAAX protease family)
MLSGPATGRRPGVQFLVWVLAASVLHTWLYERTGGSVLLVTLLHGALNTAASLLLPLYPAWSGGGAAPLPPATEPIPARRSSRA